MFEARQVSGTPKSRLTHVVALTGLAMSLFACGAEGPESAESNLRSAPREFSGHTEIKVPLENSPSGGPEFDFCRSVEPGQFDLNQAAWLSFFAANQYAHFGYLGPMLNELGFGNPDNPEDYLAEDCAIDLDLVRAYEEGRHDDLGEMSPDERVADAAPLFEEGQGFGVCGRRWREQTGWAGDTGAGASFEKWLVQTVRPESWIQFFSGGDFDMGGVFFKEGSTQVVFMRHQEKPIAIVSFRGTEPDKWLDIATDAIAFQEDLDNRWGAAHEGFVNALRSIEDLMKPKVEALEGTGVEIYVTGHSLGAALATLTSAWLLQRMEEGADYNFKGVYTVGSPRVGDAIFKARFETLARAHGVSSFRIRNQDDVVTAIPRIQDWHHINELVYLTEGKLSLPYPAPDYKGLGSISDHDSATGYYPRLWMRLNDPQYAEFRHCGSEPGTP